MARTPVSTATSELGNRVRSHREAQNLSQEELAHRSKTHWTFIGQVERGQRNIRLQNILKIANGLGIDPGELIAGMEPAPDKPGKGH